MIHECRVYRPNKDGVLKPWATYSAEKLSFLFNQSYKEKKNVWNHSIKKMEVKGVASP